MVYIGCLLFTVILNVVNARLSLYKITLRECGIEIGHNFTSVNISKPTFYHFHGR